MIELKSSNWDVWSICVSLVLIGALVVMCGRRKKMQRRCFAWFYGRYVAPGFESGAELISHKEHLFSTLKTTVSRDPELSSQGQGTIRLLEIGIGTGINLQFYPPGCRLITVEPNPHFENYFQKNRERFAHVTLESSVLGSAENMSQIPDHSVDVVVSTYVLCSVSSVQRVLEEITRILVPGGKFYYLEHVPFIESTWSRTWQCMVEPLWSFLCDDCKLTRLTSEAIAKAGFAKIEEEKLEVKKLPFVMRPHIVGIATK